jgi:hypothetical protein
MALNSLHWALAVFLVGFRERRTVSNVPELLELSHEVWQESFFDRYCCSSCGVRHDSWHARHRTWCECGIYCCIFCWVTRLVDGMMVIVEEKRLLVMEDNEWSCRVKCDFRQCWWGWRAQAGWRIPGREWRYKKSIRISSNEGELQIPKKGNVDWCIKKVRLAYSNFGPVVLTILI